MIVLSLITDSAQFFADLLAFLSDILVICDKVVEFIPSYFQPIFICFVGLSIVFLAVGRL